MIASTTRPHPSCELLREFSAGAALPCAQACAGGMEAALLAGSQPARILQPTERTKAPRASPQWRPAASALFA